MCSCFGGEYLPPLFHSVVVSRPAPPTEAFVNEPPYLPPSLPPAQPSQPLSILHHGQKKCQGETEGGSRVDYMVDYSNVSIMPFHARNGERDAFCIGLLPFGWV